MGAGGSKFCYTRLSGILLRRRFQPERTSIFSDKMGKKVAESFVNIIDDGTLENNRGSINVDDEGNDVQKTYLVKDGVLNSYIHDRISAGSMALNPPETDGVNHFDIFRCPECVQHMWSPVPIPPKRLSQAWFMESASWIIQQWSELKIGAGDFTFFVKSGYHRKW